MAVPINSEIQQPSEIISGPSSSCTALQHVSYQALNVAQNCNSNNQDNHDVVELPASSENVQSNDNIEQIAEAAAEHNSNGIGGLIQSFVAIAFCCFASVCCFRVQPNCHVEVTCGNRNNYQQVLTEVEYDARLGMKLKYGTN